MVVVVVVEREREREGRIRASCASSERDFGDYCGRQRRDDRDETRTLREVCVCVCGTARAARAYSQVSICVFALDSVTTVRFQRPIFGNDGEFLTSTRRRVDA